MRKIIAWQLAVRSENSAIPLPLPGREQKEQRVFFALASSVSFPFSIGESSNNAKKVFSLKEEGEGSHRRERAEVSPALKRRLFCERGFIRARMPVAMLEKSLQIGGGEEGQIHRSSFL